MEKKLYLKNSTVKERQKMFARAYNVAQIEFGKTNEPSREIIDDYIYGNKELRTVQRELIEYYKNEYGQEKFYPLKDNLLKLDDKNILKYACSAIVTTKIMELDAREEIEFSYETYKKNHKKLFGKIFAWAGEERTIDLEKKLEILNGRVFSYMEYENIGINMNIIFEQINDIKFMSNIDTKMSDIFNKINNAEWDDVTIEQKCALSSRVMGQLWYIHPFVEGNTTMLIYIILRLAEQNGFSFSRKIIREQHEKVDLRKCILMASLPDGEFNINYLATILLLANDVKQNESISKINTVEERKSVDSLIEEARKERERKEEESAEYDYDNDGES